ncbi:hypothetical protein F4777DRAFT_582759 [Nemania sp. FL0916]|nr:hypothetical protein F4777DRAFT_582759 [Nemania sp. FL0916]
MKSYDICTLIPPPPEAIQAVRSQAGAWPEDCLHLGVVRDRKWPQGHTIKIKLMGASDRLRRKVERYAREWTRYANIKMAFVDDVASAEVRVSFKSGGSWSLLGTDCLGDTTTPSPSATINYPPTMNLAVTDTMPEAELARQVYHEFGHVLGCVHEHQNPVGGIRWNKRLIYEYYRDNMGWDKDTVDRNVIRTYSLDRTQFSRFDRDSIMLYHFPKQLTRNGHFENPNYVLSSSDKDFIGLEYPWDAPTPPPSADMRGRKRMSPWPSAGSGTDTVARVPRRSQRIASLITRRPVAQGVKIVKRKPRRKAPAK